ncbi:MAG: glycoside hydrolase family 19 protein [Thermaurantiacus sp.]
MIATVQQLVAAGVPPTQARLFQPALAPAFQRFAINTAPRIAAFLAQCHVESAGFARLEENLWYTTPARIAAVWPSRFRSAADAAAFARNPERLANRVYAGRLGNGPEASGDGWRFRGRGLKQLTGRSNYAEAARALGRPYVTEPDLVRAPADAVLTAAWFFARAGCNALADARQWDAITRRINGPAMLAAPERRRRTTQALAALTASGALAA